MIVRLLQDWDGKKKGDIIEMDLEGGRRAMEVGIATSPTIPEVVKSAEKSPDDKVIRLAGYKQKTQEVALRKKKKKKKKELAGKRSS